MTNSKTEDFGLLSTLFLATSLLLPNKAPEKLPQVDSANQLKNLIIQKCNNAKKSGDIKLANYYDLMQSMANIESSWNPKAFNPKGGGKGAVGLFQIRLPVIKDVNARYGTNYKMEDAYDINKAAEIYRLYYNIQSGYFRYFKPNKSLNTQDMAKMYNQGCGVLTNKVSNVSKRAAESYWQKIKNKLSLNKSRVRNRSFSERISKLFS